MDIRGHHLFCIYCFYGSGQEKAEDFFGIKNAIPELLHKIRTNPDMTIVVKVDMDEVCEICPLKRPDGCGRGADASTQNTKLGKWDISLLNAIGLKNGDRITPKELEKRIIKNVPDVSVYCTNCPSAAPSGWKEFKIAIRKGLWPGKKEKSK